MAVVGAMRSGKGSRIQVSGTALTLARWNVTRRGDDLDTTNFESDGEDQGTIGVEAADWTMSGLWDADQNRFIDPPGLYPRDNLDGLRFYENTNDGIGWNIPIARVLSASNGAEVRGLVTFEANGKSNGGAGLPGV